MTQKKPACLPVVLEECGNNVERERATSRFLFVCSLTFIVLAKSAQQLVMLFVLLESE